MSSLSLSLWGLSTSYLHPKTYKKASSPRPWEALGSCTWPPIKSFKRRTRRGLACLKHYSRAMGASPESRLLVRGSTDISRHPNRPLEKRVRALRRLVPNGESMELRGLFREATDYIACLQARIKAMQIMVEVLSESSGKLPSAEKIQQRPQE